MTFWEIILIGVGLSMDAATVSLTNGMIYPNLSRSKRLLMPLLFGLFQGIMPLAGFLAGGIFAELISDYASIVVFLILGIIGGKMFKEGFHSEETLASNSSLSVRMIFWQAIATSIDAFAVGVGFSAIGIAIAPAAVIIMLTTFVISFAAVFLGGGFGRLLGHKANLLGGVILMFLAIKALLG